MARVDFRRITSIEAAILAGQRVDRRRAYALWSGFVCIVSNWTQPCSGCHEGYEYSDNAFRGGGCSECGYTGRRREEWWSPLRERDLGPWYDRVFGKVA